MQRGFELRRVVGGIGRALIAFGLLVLLFVAYQLWGTSFREAQAQDDLREAFRERVAETTSTTAAPEPARPGASRPTTTTEARPAPPPPPEGEAVAMMRIPRLGLEKAVIEGVRVADLKKAPGHYPTTPMPGQPGNAAIAGHRTTYGAPFYRLDELEEGDEILVTTLQGEFRYEVDRTIVVSPDEVEVLAPTEESRLTLTTCEPRFSARSRLIVSAVLAGEPAPAPDPPAERDADEEPDANAGRGQAPPPSFEDAAGLSGDPAARGPTVLWGAIAAAVAAAIWWVGRRFKRWPAYLVGAPIFLVVLFVFFEQVARLLPANI